MKTTTATVLFLAALAAGCRAPGIVGPGDDPPRALEAAPIQPDSAVYHLRTSGDLYRLTIGVTYTNPTASAVYVPTCRTPHPPVLEKWQEGRWVTAYSPVVLQCLGPPVVIGAGAAYPYTYRVEAGRRPNLYPRFEVAEIPGTYRLVWDVYRSAESQAPEGLLPLEQRVSGPFRIEG